LIYCPAPGNPRDAERIPEVVCGKRLPSCGLGLVTEKPVCAAIELLLAGVQHRGFTPMVQSSVNGNSLGLAR